MVNSEMLREAMERANVPESWAADKLKLAQSSLNLKINNKRAFAIPEMFLLSDLLALSLDEMRAIFFAESVAKRNT